LKSSCCKASKRILVLVTGVCLSASGWCADTSTANSTHQQATHSAGRTGGTPAAASARARQPGRTRHSGSTHHAGSRTAAHTSAGKGASHHSTSNASYQTGSSSRGRRHRATSSQQRLARLHLQPERVQEIQQALIREGYLQGDATGQWDSRTHDAMLRYQTMHGFPATGLPEAKSLMKLGLGAHPLPPELDRSVVGVASPAAAPGDLSVTPPSPPVSQAVPPALDATPPQPK